MYKAFNQANKFFFWEGEIPTLTVSERSIESSIIERACKIVLFVIAANWFTPFFTSKVFTLDFWESKCKFCSLNVKVKWVYSLQGFFITMTDMTSVIEIGGNSFEKMFLNL